MQWYKNESQSPAPLCFYCWNIVCCRYSVIAGGSNGFWSSWNVRRRVRSPSPLTTIRRLHNRSERGPRQYTGPARKYRGQQGWCLHAYDARVGWDGEPGSLDFDMVRFNENRPSQCSGRTEVRPQNTAGRRSRGVAPPRQPLRSNSMRGFVYWSTG